jgi:hypothetical protein
MKITGFCPMIVTQNADPIIRLFEELGFVIIHGKNAIAGVEMNRAVTMKNADGFRIVIDETKAEGFPEFTAVRMNVDDLEETYDMLKQKGFKNLLDDMQDILIRYGFKDNLADFILKTDSSKSALMVSPSGFVVNVIKHIKKSERTAEK